MQHSHYNQNEFHYQHGKMTNSYCKNIILINAKYLKHRPKHNRKQKTHTNDATPLAGCDLIGQTYKRNWLLDNREIDPNSRSVIGRISDRL